jgi:mannose-1-phosphate guanylyltransferase/mannose-6-phosphate isomerase
MSSIIPVILSGGSGKRLWPLSRELMPKQLLPLVTERTLLQETVVRARAVAAAEAPIVVCNEAHCFLVAEQLRGIGVKPQAIVLEPAGRNTAPAVAVAALMAGEEDVAAKAAPTRSKKAAAKAAPTPSTGGSGFSRDPLLLVLPADHVIRDTAAFVAAVEAATEAAVEGRLVTFGVTPDRPETGYGYIRKGKTRGRCAELEWFFEKPDAATAQRYVDSGEYLWNSGMFLFAARAYLDELARLQPKMLEACRRSVAAGRSDGDFTRLGAAFGECPAGSIDYEVFEKTQNAAVVPLAAGWSDVGSWAALHAVLDKDSLGNVVRGDVIAKACKNSYLAASDRLVVAVGLDGIIVVETADAVLVMSAADSQRVKEIVDALKAAGREEARAKRDRD